MQGDKVMEGIEGIWLPVVTEAYKVCKAIGKYFVISTYIITRLHTFLTIFNVLQ